MVINKRQQAENLRHALIGLLGAFSVTAVGGGLGQAAAESPAVPVASPNTIEQLVVTATKRETTLQTTPLAVSVFTGNDLDDAGARAFGDYFRRVPGLTVVDNGTGRKRYIIRGVNAQQSPMMAATVAQYVDEVPITNNFDLQPDPRLVDIERIEVLRGPQGTLFGARSMSGTIRTITRKPTFERIDGSASITLSGTHYGGANENAEGILNVPLATNIAVRLNAFYQHDDGYIDNVFPGGAFNLAATPLPAGLAKLSPVTLPAATQDNYSDVTSYGGRVAFRWAANDRLTIDVSGLGQYSDIGAQPSYNPALTGSGPFRISATGNRGNEDTLLLATGTINYDMDWARATAVGAYSYRDNEILDNAPANTIALGGQTNNLGGVTKGRTFEVRLASQGPGRIQWLVGGYYSDQDQNALATSQFGFGSVTAFQIFSNGVSKEYAGFGEITYEFVERLKFTAGLRYSDSQTALNQIFYVPPPNSPFAPGGTNPNPPRFTENNISLKFSASYQVSPDLFTYFTASQGYRPGSFNATAIPGYTAVPASYDHDSLWNYEIGAKTSVLNRRLTIDGALYRIDWSNMQAESFAPPPVAGAQNLSYVANASSARIIGLELETTAQLTERLTANINFNHLFDSKLTADTPITPVGFKPRAGDRLPYSAKTTFSVDAQYLQPLTDALNGFFTVSWSYSDARTSGFRPLLENGRTNTAYNIFPSYHLLGLRTGITDGSWRATLFVDNVADARPTLQQINFSTGNLVTRITAKPRTVGVTLSRRL